MRWPRPRQAPGHWPGVFAWAPRSLLALLLLVAAPLLLADDCRPTAALEQARVAYVIDGDTVVLRSGRHVRLLGINAPEVAHRDRAGEPFGRAAKHALAELLPPDSPVWLQPGVQVRDHYGRELAHLFRSATGGSVEDILLAEGLAEQVVVPPNEALAGCFARAESEARRAGRGLWHDPYFAPRDARSLRPGDGGFRRVRLTVARVEHNRGGWWLETGGALVVHVTAADAGAFASSPAHWTGRTLVVRGWIRDRSNSSAVRRHGYAPLLLPLRHPVMLESGL